MWKIIDGHNERYSVSSLGRVRNNETDTILKERHNHNKGYVQYVLSYQGKKRYSLAHRLVALAFIDNPDSLPEVNHVDGNKKNNTYLNLEWVNRSKNNKHAYENDLRKPSPQKGEKHGMAKVSNSDVLYIWEKGLTAKEVASKYNMTYTNARDIVTKKTWKHLQTGGVAYDRIKEEEVI